MSTPTEPDPSHEHRFTTKSVLEDHPASIERSLDADELEKTLQHITRPSARAHVESLINKLRRDSATLKRVEASHAKAQEEGVNTLAIKPESAVVQHAPVDMEVAPPKSLIVPEPAPHPTYVTVSTPIEPKFTTIDHFAFDVGSYNSQFVTIYIDMPEIGELPKENISCNFTKSTVDLQIHGLKGKNYRMYRDNFDKDIDPSHCKYLIKPNKIVVKLAKCKGEYGSYDHWSDLTAKKKKKEPGLKGDDPSAGIMELMKEMYESGDDNMKKMIGETMLKQQRGELGQGADGMPGMPGMGDFGKLE